MIDYVLNLLGLRRIQGTSLGYGNDNELLMVENQLLRHGLSTTQEAIAELQAENDALKKQLSKIAKEDEAIRKQLLQELDLLLLHQTSNIGEA